MKSYSPELAYFCLFLVSLWFSGTLFEELLQCRLVGELLIGIVFGNVNSLLPHDKSAIILAGEVGVLGLVFEAGLGTNLGRILKAGPRSALVAFVGTVTPLATGFGFIYAIVHLPALQGSISDTFSINIVTEALASGAALASTSIACAVTLMKQRGILETQVGTLVTTAAMIDDVASLILLSIVSRFGNPEPGEGTKPDIGPMTIIQPIVASLGVILFGFIACVVKAKYYDSSSSEQAIELSTGQESGQAHEQDDPEANPEGYEGASQTNEAKKAKPRCSTAWNRIEQIYNTFAPTIKLAAMIISSLGFSFLTEYLGSSRLLGIFVAGVFFSSFCSLRLLYDENVAHNLQPAMSAIFFASIGFAIPLSKILDPALFGWGIVYTVIASFSKLITAFLVPSSTQTSSDGIKLRSNDRWLVGTAMIARGELGLLMVQQALLQGIMGQPVMIVTTWSIVLSTLVGIGAMGFVMNRA
ncbi:hypothetical protein BGX27_006044 [Mortierella sp. AM989]|nr:hypothetical protein BGX27_006044 [Mortierella sp. AM989]